MKQVSYELSIRFKALSIMAMLTVLWLHGYNLQNSPDCAVWNQKIQDLFWIQMTNWAVPTFFVISGFFFCWSCREGVTYREFYEKKLRQLLIPYLVWCLYGLVLGMALLIAYNLKMHHHWLERTPFEEKSLFTAIDKTFGILRSGPNENGPLWYVRTLMLLFCFAPVWCLAYQKINIYMLAVIAFVCVFFPGEIKWLHIGITNIGWFLLGVWAHKVSLFDCPAVLRRNNVILYVSFVLWIICAGLRANVIPNWLNIPCQTLFCYKLMALCGMAVMWEFSEKFARFSAKRWFHVLTPSFFIYCAHFPICMWIKTIGRFTAQGNDFGLLFFAVITPVLTLSGGGYSCIG